MFQNMQNWDHSKKRDRKWVEKNVCEVEAGSCQNFVNLQLKKLRERQVRKHKEKILKVSREK
jgi:hypothetical protein